MPYWLRILFGTLWLLFVTGAQELLTTMRRLPSWEDVQYLTDPVFMKNSTASFNVSSPLLFWLMALSLLLLLVLPVARSRRLRLMMGVALAGGVLLIQDVLSDRYDDLSVAARYNALQWFVHDAMVAPPRLSPEQLAVYPLPKGTGLADLEGSALLDAKGSAKNVLIIVLEGMPGLYYPEIRNALGMESSVSMDRLAQVTPQAMLVPDFVAHSHQTIRGLYALLCGDFSKLSFDTPKAVELQGNPQRAQQCLPSQLAKSGWETHYLQGAELSFMGKDRFMPLIGFQDVHGKEWFKERNPFPFEWGMVDSTFFKGAKRYIDVLRKKRNPWMLTLLTVGTHQPYAVPDDVAERYPDRKVATVDLLDMAVAKFIHDLRKNGVLKDTLVIVTSDESHGSDDFDWVSSWGLGMVMAPESDRLPRIKKGGYGLVDVEASVLDYLGLKVPSEVVGRSMFRDYSTPREMLAFTASKWRWHTADNLRYECTEDGRCRMGTADSLLGSLPKPLDRDSRGEGRKIFHVSAALDARLTAHHGKRLLRFANGEVRRLPEKVANDWTDNLVGAQYLDFPARSKVKVSIRVKVIKAPQEGVQLRLALKQWEAELSEIAHDNFPVLHANQEGRLEFAFENVMARQAFSFHLLGEGKGAVVQLDEFDVTIDQGG